MSHTKFFPKLRDKKEIQGWLIVARSRYGYFNAYHKKFKHKMTANKAYIMVEIGTTLFFYFLKD